MFIAGNWKMYKGPAEVTPFLEALKERVGGLPVRVAIAPPFPLLAPPPAREPIELFAQNVHWETEGAYTGEVSPQTLLQLHVDGAIVGHSERRQYFGETDEVVARRARAALAAGLSVIACVGETQEQRDSGDTELVLRIQVEAVRAAVGAHERLVLAYEPVWAIGTGKTAAPAQAQEAHAFVKGLLEVPVLYGGSVKPANAEELLSQPDVDGALVGGASLDLDSFTAICRTAARIGS
jgi:triosephosphate isomerase (TIM)